MAVPHLDVDRYPVSSTPLGRKAQPAPPGWLSWLTTGRSSEKAKSDTPDPWRPISSMMTIDRLPPESIVLRYDLEGLIQAAQIDPATFPPHLRPWLEANQEIARHVFSALGTIGCNNWPFRQPPARAQVAVRQHTHGTDSMDDGSALPRWANLPMPPTAHQRVAEYGPTADEIDRWLTPAPSLVAARS